MDYTYHMPTKVRFGRGAAGEIKSFADELKARKILIVTGKGSMRKTGILDGVLDALTGCDVDVFEKVESDPSVDTVDEGVKAAEGCDIIVGLGGGSALDASKAISAVAGNGGEAAEYLEGRKIERPGPRIIAVPTTAGTASEVTEVSVLSDRRRKIKKALRSPHMYPAIALDDPELTVTMPKEVTVSTGLDALSHGVEALASKNSQPIPDVLCMEAVKLVLNNLQRAYDDGSDMRARENMLLASLMAGFGITHAGAGLAHGLSYSLWKVADMPHGLACGLLLPHVMRFNLGHDQGKYRALAAHCGYKSPEDLIGRVEELNATLKVPQRLRSLKVKEADIPSMVKGAGGGVKVNPRQVNEAELASFIKSLL